MKKLFAVLAFGLPLAGLAQWPTHHGNNARTGKTNISIPANPSIVWSVDLQGPVTSSPVVAADGTIYVGATWREERRPRSFVTAMNPNGTIKWQYETKWVDYQTHASPALGPDGTIYIGDASGAFHAIYPNGTQKWKLQGTEPVRACPLVAPDGTIYIQMDNQLRALRPDGTEKWRYPVNINWFGAPTLDPNNGAIYTNSDQGLLALNPDGTKKWSSWVGSGGTVAVHPNGTIILVGYFMAVIDPATGDTTTFLNGGNSYEPDVTPSIDSAGNIYVIKSWSLVKYTPALTQVWERLFIEGNMLGTSHGSALIDGQDRIVQGMGFGKRWAIGIEKAIRIYNTAGTLLKVINLPEIPGYSSPAIGPDGTLYIGCVDGRVYAIR